MDPVPGAARLASRQLLGISLLFAALPFARIFTAAVGGGDEKVLFSALLGEGAAALTVRVFALGSTVLLGGVPIVLGVRRLAAGSRLPVAGTLCILPLLVSFLLIHKGYNYGLAATPALQPVWAGTPLGVWLHLASMILMSVALRRNLYSAPAVPLRIGKRAVKTTQHA